MCLGIPGKVVELDDSGTVLRGKVEFGGIRKQICLAYVPDVQVGEYVIVHVGFAISKMDEQEAGEVFALLREMDGLAELAGDTEAGESTGPA